MRIIGYTSSHDGNIVLVENGTLIFSIEGEKDSQDRYSPMNPLRQQAIITEHSPNILASSNYPHPLPPGGDNYFGIKESYRTSVQKDKYLAFSTTHERAHILCAYGLSPWSQGQPCYCLCWEGVIGHFYRIDEKLRITEFPFSFSNPGQRYLIPFGAAEGLLDKDTPVTDTVGFSWPGKVMALAGFGRETDRWDNLISLLLDEYYPPLSYFQKSSLRNIGAESQDFKDFAKKYSDKLFDRFFTFAKDNLTEGLPLLITGGCGLNCDWNTAWKNSGLFSDIFIPPVPSDAGQGIGLAIDAQLYYTGNAKLEWSVYAGEEFIEDIQPIHYESSPLNLDELSSILMSGEVIAWVQGKYEIGPRALCHRSLLAIPYHKTMHDTLNKIKQRESYRPIAPVCTEESVNKYFEWEGPSPYMLNFMKVKSPSLEAVTHVDGTARTQTLNEQQDPRTYRLLQAMENKVGVPILCNTSLNFKGKGFINRMSDLLRYVEKTGIKVFVVNDKMYTNKVGG